MEDDGPLETAQVGWLGDDCDAGLVIDGLAETSQATVRDGSGAETTLNARWSIRSAPPPPSGCSP